MKNLILIFCLSFLFSCSSEKKENNQIIEKKSELDDENYYRKERKVGSFYRSVSLPINIHGEKAEADYESGILKISLPKMPEGKTTQIKIAKK